MKRRKIHIAKLSIRLPRGASANAKGIAGDIGREILRSVGETVRGMNHDAAIGEISVGGIRMSARTAAETASKTAAAVRNELNKGGRR